MTPERWRRARKIFEAALAYQPPERDRFLLKTCGNDADLRLEVENLLLAHEHASTTIKTAGAKTLFGDESGDRDRQIIGQRIGPYQLVHLLGRGGMGVVYLAARADGAFQKQVAVKIIQPNLDQQAAERFRQERQILANLDHPNIARLLDGGTTPDGLPYLVMEYVEGRSLRQMLQEQGALPLTQIVEIAGQVCAAVEAAHRLGVIHRDLKPENIVVNERNNALIVKTLDFGIAKLVDEEAFTKTIGFIGTVAYCSPEQINPRAYGQVDERADVYSLGLVIYELLTGQAAFRAGSLFEMLQQQTGQLPPAPDRVRPDLDIPPAVGQVVIRALQKDRTRRQQTMEELGRELELAASGASSFSDPARKKPIHRSVNAWRARRLLLVTIALLVAGLAIFAFIKFRADRRVEHPLPISPTPVLSQQLLSYGIFLVGNGKRIESLPAEGVVRTGDEIEFEITLERPGAIYLLYQDAESRAWIWLNPLPGGQPQIGQKAERLTIPSEKPLQMQAPAEPEQFWIIFAPQNVDWSLAKSLEPEKPRVKKTEGLNLPHAEISRAAAQRVSDYLDQRAVALTRTVTQAGTITTHALFCAGEPDNVAAYKFRLTHLKR